MKARSLTFLVLAALLAACSGPRLSNGNLSVSQPADGPVVLTGEQVAGSVTLKAPVFRITVDGREYRSDSLGKPEQSTRGGVVERKYRADGLTIRMVDELQPEWEFLSRQLFVESSDGQPFKVNRIVMLESSVEEPIGEAYSLTGGRYGLALRFKGGEMPYGCFMLIQNPYSTYETEGQRVRLSYDPEMNWDPKDGAFPSDRMCIGLYRMTGTTYRQDMAPEWAYEKDPAAFLAGGSRIDLGEVKAVTACASEFLTGQPQQGVRVHVGWCENDYQIDVATPEGREEYRRMIDQAAATGCNYVLYTPDNSKVASLTENADAWGWESLLFLNLGQKIRKGEWIPGRDSLPADILEILNYAKSKNIKLLAYAYPSLPFMQDSAWTAWRTKIGQKPEGYLTVDTGIRSFQDWWVDLLVTFYRATGIGGYSFDHWWMAYTDEAGLVSSKYQQWFGTRRILEELRKREPEMIVDGRQQYHGFGTWTWLAGTYPHPLMTDEQPGSFNSFPDLSTDRVTAGRQRWVAWRLMTRDFTPVEVRPGFMTHQTQRNDAGMVMRRDRFRTRDWDYLGWKFNVIASVATAPFNHVVNYLPARDLQEFNAFSRADRDFFREWMDFTDRNAAYWKNLLPIIGQPMVGRCDGTSAIKGDNGFIFLFNPNYRRLTATFRLDESVGLHPEGSYLLSTLFPLRGMNIGQPAKGFYRKGDVVEIPLDGVTAMVIRVEPAGGLTGKPVLFNYTGRIAIRDGHLGIDSLSGIVGSTGKLLVSVPASVPVSRLTVNGTERAFARNADLIETDIGFAGVDFRQAEQIGNYDPAFAGREVEAQFTVPRRIRDQLRARKSAWPVDYTEDDLLAPWLDPSRLLLYIQIAWPFRRDTVNGYPHDQPIRGRELSVSIDGRPVPVKEAYNGVYPYVERTSLGFFVDISSLEPDVTHRIRLTLPDGLKPGQFQGLFFDHVENEYTAELKR